MKGLGPIQKKILILLVGWIAVGLSQSPRRQWQIIGEMRREWHRVSREGKAKAVSTQSLNRSIRKLYESKLIDIRQESGGVWKMTLTEKGRKRVLQYDLQKISITKPKQWDRKWRMVLFDIPETKKKNRDAIRYWLKKWKFYQLQASVFVSPYECRDEFDFLMEIHGMRKYVRYATLLEIDNEEHLKQIFQLSKPTPFF